MTGRWKVRRHNYVGYTRIGQWCWVVMRPAPGGIADTFSTHDEALAYADKQARTVTIQLPADPDRHAPCRGFVSSPDAPFHYLFGAQGWGWTNTISLEPSQIEPFALALLAHARKGTQ